MEKYLISIFGKAGSGKSTLANNLVKLYGDQATRIRGDHYLFSKPQELSWDEYFLNDQYDWELINKHYELPQGTIIDSPTFDFQTFQRISEGGDKPSRISKLNFVDALFPMPNADFYIGIETSEELSKQRIELRNRETYSDPWCVWIKSHQGPEIVLPNTNKLLLLDATLSEEEMVAKVEVVITKKVWLPMSLISK